MKEIHTVDYLPTARGFWQPRLVIIIIIIINNSNKNSNRSGEIQHQCSYDFYQATMRTLISYVFAKERNQRLDASD